VARIVVADNDPDALELVVTDLRLEGHDIVGAARDAAEAAVLVADHEPDVVVLDHRMPPGLTGLELAAVLRAEQPALAVVLYSNYQDVALIRRAQELGVPFLPKGNLRNLRRAVERAATGSG
jgi:CheY-like chemotaxis protein